MSIITIVRTTYELVKVDPDCGGGICDRETNLIESDDIDKLQKYCETTYSYSPLLGDKRRDSDKKYCMSWYKIVEKKSNILI